VIRRDFLAKALGASTIAVVSSDEKERVARAAGSPGKKGLTFFRPAEESRFRPAVWRRAQT